MPIDYNTSLGKVRVLTGDTDETLLYMVDAELNTLLSLNNGDVYLSAADALEVMSTKMAVIQQKIKTLDLQTDGPAVAKALMDRAKEMRSRVATASEDFELIDVVNAPLEYWNI